MPTIRVHLEENSYDIITGNRMLLQLGKSLKKLDIGCDAIIITNKYIRKLHGRTLTTSLRKSGFSIKIFEVPDTERSKSTRVAMRLLENIARYDVKKKVFLIAFGGGVIGDLAGFVAAVYKRGIPYVQVPTTFLAQIDSAIGGKTAVDLSLGKNLVGAFYQPRLVFSDVALLTTLSGRQIKNGLAEAVKYGVICDRTLFAYIGRNYKKLLKADVNALQKIVLNCSRIKASVVARDEKETKGIRTILNFGHTLGHAIEAAGGYKQYHHGEAIALGMRIAALISYKMKVCSRSHYEAVERLLSDIGLPQRAHNMRTKEILSIMAHDKKFKSQRNRFVLLVQVGWVRVIERVPHKVIKDALQEYIG